MLNDTIDLCRLQLEIKIRSHIVKIDVRGLKIQR